MGAGASAVERPHTLQLFKGVGVALCAIPSAHRHQRRLRAGVVGQLWRRFCVCGVMQAVAAASWRTVVSLRGESKTRSSEVRQAAATVGKDTPNLTITVSRMGMADDRRLMGGPEANPSLVGTRAGVPHRMTRRLPPAWRTSEVAGTYAPPGAPSVVVFHDLGGWGY